MTTRGKLHRWLGAVVVACLLLGPRLAYADKVDVLISRMLKSKDYKERLNAALNLAKIQDPRAIPAFIEALDDEDKTVRGVAASALGKQINSTTDPAVRKRALDKLKEVAAKDPNSFVRKQAQKSYDIIKGLESGGAPSGATVYVDIGKMSDSTKSGTKILNAMRGTVEKTIRKGAPKWATAIPGTEKVTSGVLKKNGMTGFHVDGTITELEVTRSGSSAKVSCKVSMLIATYPEKSMFGFLKGGAAVTVANNDKEIEFAKEDCVVAVAEDLTRRQIIPTIERKAP